MRGLWHHLVAGMSVRDVLVALLDLAIVYYLIYRALRLIRGTRAAQMLIGLVLLGGGLFLAKQFELTTVTWLLDNFTSYGILLIIVVFQHDIRRGLVRLGRNLFAPTRLYEETHVLEEVIQAAVHLGETRTGALIVLERDADLGEFLEAGMELDARVSRELLISLFLPNPENVMHDGAVLIKNFRIAQAGAVLPLSASTSLDKSLGTRHRAALGVTEETDAVAVVVSEERGQVSLCFGGEIRRDLDSQALRKALLGLFYKQRHRKPRSVGPLAATRPPQTATVTATEPAPAAPEKTEAAAAEAAADAPPAPPARPSAV